tara:strand:+ start:210 stop:542 length:333 start_codon:yes stop_codon:yes gene_type:complete
MSRYKGRKKVINSTEMYEDVLEDRGVKQVVQYTTPSFKYPSPEAYQRIRTVDYVWGAGDKFWRLAALRYGDPTLWWIIAQFNQKPTEHHCEIGETIKIPLDLAVALGAMT